MSFPINNSFVCFLVRSTRERHRSIRPMGGSATATRIQSLHLQRDKRRRCSERIAAKSWRAWPIHLLVRISFENFSKYLFIYEAYQTNSRQHRKKHNIRFSRDRERASYFSQMTFQFDEKKSHPLTQDDKIVVLNMHMNVSTIINLIHLFCYLLNNWPSKYEIIIYPFC